MGAMSTDQEHFAEHFDAVQAILLTVIGAMLTLWAGSSVFGTRMKTSCKNIVINVIRSSKKTLKTLKNMIRS